MEDHVLGVDARAEPARHLDPPHLGLAERQRLRGEHVAHLARTDAEGDRTERAVRRGVRVAAGDGDAGLGEALLGADHVDDALLTGRRVEEGDAVTLAVLLERDHHLFGERVLERPLAGVCRDDVIDGGERALGVGNGEVEAAQHAERLRARHLVDQVKRDEELRLPVRQRTDRMRFPDLVEEALCHFAAAPAIQPSHLIALGGERNVAHGYRLPTTGKESAMSLR